MFLTDSATMIRNSYSSSRLPADNMCANVTLLYFGCNPSSMSVLLFSRKYVATLGYTYSKTWAVTNHGSYWRTLSCTNYSRILNACYDKILHKYRNHSPSVCIPQLLLFTHIAVLNWSIVVLYHLSRATWLPENTSFHSYMSNICKETNLSPHWKLHLLNCFFSTDSLWQLERPHSKCFVYRLARKHLHCKNC